MCYLAELFHQIAFPKLFRHIRQGFSESGATPNNVLFGGTVPPKSVLFGRTVLPNSVFFGGTVPPNSVLFGGTVPPNTFPHSFQHALKSMSN